MDMECAVRVRSSWDECSNDVVDPLAPVTDDRQGSVPNVKGVSEVSD